MRALVQVQPGPRHPVRPGQTLVRGLVPSPPIPLVACTAVSERIPSPVHRCCGHVDFVTGWGSARVCRLDRRTAPSRSAESRVSTRCEAVAVMAVRRLSIILVLLLALSGGLTAARVGLAPAGAVTGDSVVLAWNQQVLDAIVATETGPTIAARALAVVHTAIYDAWAAYDPVAVDTRQRLRVNPDLRQPAAERTVANKNKAVSFAAYAALVDLFPGQDQQNAFATQMGDLHYAIDGSDL